MIKMGYALSSEEHNPNDLVQYGERAEQVGFDFAVISDHYHPWIDRQGNSPFVWCVIGGIAQRTKNLRLGTGVTCPLIRIHPAIIAHAAATAAAMLPGRFFLGLGAGENLNEHILGGHWPEGRVRLEMFEEAVEVIRGLWKGEYYSHHGRYYEVEEARLYTLPDELPPIYLAADGERAAELAGRRGDGLIGSTVDAEVIEQFRSAGGEDKPRYGHLTVCWAQNEERGRRIAYEIWPNSALEGNLSWEVKTPKLFEDAAKSLREEDVAKRVICGPDPEPYLERIEKLKKAGYDHIWLHQIGPDQEGFFKFYQRQLASKL